MIVGIILAIVLPPVLYIIINYVSHLMKLKDYPPGPFPLPIIGNLHLLGAAKPYIGLTNLAKIYGDVYSISYGMNRVVMVNTIEPAREALITKGSIFAGRPQNYYSGEIVSRGFQDMFFADYGPGWKMIRKLAHTSLFGEGMHKLESLVVKEFDEMHLRLRELNGNPADVHYEIGLAVMNIISTIVFGTRYEMDDPEFKEVIAFSSLIISGIAESDVVAFMPWLRFFPHEGLEKLRKGISIKDPIIRRKYLEHKETYDGENLRDLTDLLIKALLEEKVKGTEKFTLDNLELILTDLVIAGAETTLSTLRWCVLYLLHWPQYQEMLYKEIIEVVGTDQYPDMHHKSSMHLLQAIMHETLRLSGVLPFSGLHKAMEKSEVSKMSIPKGGYVLFNLWNINHDQRYWKNHDEFYPERWLDESGKFNPVNQKSYLPFSAGRRVCFGESLAKLEIFSFLSRLIRDFTFEMAAGIPLPSLEPVFLGVLHPQKFECVFKPRNIEKRS